MSKKQGTPTSNPTDDKLTLVHDADSVEESESDSKSDIEL